MPKPELLFRLLAKDGTILVPPHSFPAFRDDGTIAAKQKELNNGDEDRELSDSEAGEFEGTIKDYFRIPKDAFSIDTLCRRSKLGKGGAAKGLWFTIIEYANLQSWYYLDGDNLVIALATVSVSIPRNKIMSLSMKRKMIMLPFWNKERQPDPGDPEVFVNANTGLPQIRKYCSMLISGNEMDYQVMIPEYDARHISKLLDMRIG